MSRTANEPGRVHWQSRCVGTPPAAKAARVGGWSPILHGDPCATVGGVSAIDALFLTTEFKPDADSGSLRLRYLLALLRESHRSVELVLLQERGLSPVGRQLLERLDVAWCIAADQREAERSLSAGRGRGDQTLVIISRPQAAARWMAPIRRLLPAARLLYDTVDLHYVRLFRQAKLTGDARLLRHALEHKRVELQACAAADVTLVVSEAERDTLAAEGVDSVAVVSNVHEIIDPRSGPAIGHAGRSGLLFIGGFLHQPNVDAAQYLGREVYPAIRRRCPGVALNIVGGHPPPEVRALAQRDHGGGLWVTGQVADVQPLFDTSLASIAPLRYGAGVKGKVSRSLSSGLPVVASTVAVEGMPVRDGEEVLIADHPEAFADCVANLVADPDLWHKLSRGGLQVAERHYSLAAARAGLEQAITRS